MKHLRRFLLVLGLVGAAAPARLAAQGTAFTYQGHLQDHGTPATGSYDMRFVLRDAVSGGSQVPGTPVPAGLVAVSNGQFTATLDFGATAFNGSPRWLEISVRTNGSVAAHTTLVPRQPLTATPYATMANAAATYTGAVSDSQLSANVARLNAPQSFSGLTTFSPASGAPFAVSSTNRVNNLHADLLDGFSANAFWNIGGNAGTSPSNFLGTIDNQPLQFRVNNSPALRLEPNATSPNFVAGHSGNFVAPGIAGATIGGGGASGATNAVAALHGTVAGGRANRVISNFGTVGGGDSNVVSNVQATVGGGLNNIASGVLATVSGGGTNVAGGSGATVGGGSQNASSGLRTVIGGGANNSAAGNYSVVAGGRFNIANGLGAAVLGGIANEATNSYATILGGFDNVASGFSSFAAGTSAQALHDGAFVWADVSGPVLASTAPNQFLIRAAGGVGIGGPPEDAALDVEGDTRINDHDIFLRGGTDKHHGLGWYGSTKTFAGLDIDGPVAYGWSGGALGTVQGGDRVALRWTSGGNVGIGTSSPGTPLHVSAPGGFAGTFESSNPGGTWLTLRNTGGGDAWNILATGSANGEGAGHLLFYNGDTGARTILRDNGSVGIGTTSPRDLLEVRGGDAMIRIVNANDHQGNLGAFAGDTWGTLQLGMFNETASSIGVIAAGTRRSFFGCDNLGRVGSLLNTFGSPSFRNLLDDGNGNLSVSANGGINFGTTTRQMLNLWNAEYGIGVQAFTMYQRSGGNFAWYRGGAHADGAYDSGGGTTLMRLDSGGLTVNGTFISSSDRERKANFTEVKPREVLERLASMPIQKWNYMDDEGVRHIGPMAQDFHAAFGVGPDEKHIAMVDADGVALAAIQGLHEVVKEKDEQIESLQKDNEALQDRLAALEKIVSALADHVREAKR